jgi:hypothetical protein
MKLTLITDRYPKDKPYITYRIEHVGTNGNIICKYLYSFDTYNEAYGEASRHGSQNDESTCIVYNGKCQTFCWAKSLGDKVTTYALKQIAKKGET